MKKLLITFPALILSSQMALAASLSSQCSDNKFTIEYEVTEGQTCTANQTVIINGDTTNETLTLTETGSHSIDLTDGDSASASVNMECTADMSTMSLSTSISTENGCNGTLDGNVTNPGSGDGSDAGNGTTVDYTAQLQQKLDTMLEMVEREVARIQSTTEFFADFGDFAERYVELRKSSLERRIERQLETIRTMYEGKVSDEELSAAISEFETLFNELMSTI